VDRREFIGTIGVGLTATRVVAEAQPVAGARHVVVVTAGANPRTASFYVAFETRLRELGWTAGRTIIVEFVTPKPDETSAAVAAEVVRHNPDVIVTAGPEEPLRAARRSTTTIPIIVVAINYDPVAKGYVASLARPAGNVTGVFFQQFEVDAKQLELFKEILPKGALVAVMWEPNSADQLQSVESSARLLGVSITKIEILAYDFESAFRRAQDARAAGVLVLGSPVVYRERGRIGQLALRHRLPSAGSAAVARDSGLLLGFGADLDALFRRAAEYVDKMLRGAKPADLPVEQPTKFQLVINLKTAKALGLTVPQSVLLRADEVIE
jgi:putative ABC transport system substrate-binding protein